jgi:hypothetical protein
MHKEKQLKVMVCYLAMETYYLPLKARLYKPTATDERKEKDSIAAYICDHNCAPDKKDSDDWQIVDWEKVDV